MRLKLLATGPSVEIQILDFAPLGTGIMAGALFCGGG